MTLGMTTELQQLNTEANAIRSAAQAIGLKAEFKAVSAAELHQLLHRSEGPRGIDGFFTDQLPRLRRPGRLYDTLVLPDGAQNYGATTTPRSRRR